MFFLVFELLKEEIATKKYNIPYFAAFIIAL